MTYKMVFSIAYFRHITYLQTSLTIYDITYL